MKVQTKILLLLLAIIATLVGGLVALKVFEQKKFAAIAASSGKPSATETLTSSWMSAAIISRCSWRIPACGMTWCGRR